MHRIALGKALLLFRWRALHRIAWHKDLDRSWSSLNLQEAFYLGRRAQEWFTLCVACEAVATNTLRREPRCQAVVQHRPRHEGRWPTIDRPRLSLVDQPTSTTLSTAAYRVQHSFGAWSERGLMGLCWERRDWASVSRLWRASGLSILSVFRPFGFYSCESSVSSVHFSVLVSSVGS